MSKLASVFNGSCTLDSSLVVASSGRFGAYLRTCAARQSRRGPASYANVHSFRREVDHNSQTKPIRVGAKRRWHFDVAMHVLTGHSSISQPAISKHLRAL